jgi:hypothetical protein
MTTIHAHIIGECALLSRPELERLLELARRSEPVELELHEETEPEPDMMRLAQQGGAFDFWHDEGENIYSAEDGEPLR